YGEQPLKSLHEGKLHLVLAGEKAKGEWTLVRIRGRDGEKNQWLILKTGGSAKPPSKKAEDQSVKTGRTMKQIAEERDAEWESNRKEEPQTARSKLNSRIKAALKKKDQENGGEKIEALQDVDLALKRVPNAKPRFIEPMKARLVDEPPSHGDWLYELKFDGIRAIADKNKSKISLISRNGNKLDTRFPDIAKAVKKLPVRECVIDGEVVALDDEGRSSFQLF